MPRTTYQPPTVEMMNPKLCHFCNVRKIAPGLTLRGIACCKNCFGEGGGAEMKPRKTLMRAEPRESQKRKSG